MAQNIPSYVPKNGLVGYWPFNGNANDESGNGNHGTVNGATLTADRNGVANSAYSFDGKNDIYIDKSTHPLGEVTVTYSFWVESINSNQVQSVLDVGNAGYPNQRSAIHFVNNNFKYCGEGNDFDFPYQINQNKWDHYLITKIGNQVSLYSNGKFVYTTKLNLGQHLTSSKIVFGSNNVNWNGGEYFQGKLDDIAIYNRALSEQEIAALYNENPISQNIPSYVPKNGLVGYWPFNGNANDESGNGNHGTVNGATLTADRNGVANSAYSFDGKNDIYIDKSTHPLGEVTVTYSFWVESINSNQVQSVLDVGNAGYPNQRSAIHFVNNNFKYCGEGNDFDFPYQINQNKWDHYLITKIGNQVSLYSNGKFVYTTKLNLGQHLTSSKIVFGSNNVNWNGGEYFQGKLDDIAIYNRALSEQEIAALYTGSNCSKENATSSSFNSLLFTNGSDVSITAEPQGGVFSGSSIENNLFIPSKAKIGSNKVKYNFKNSQGCADSTVFSMVVADTVGANCTKYDTVIINKTKYDTVIVKTNVFDTVKVTKYDTLKVTKFDTITVKNNVYDTVTITNNVTKYDTVSILKINFKLTTGIYAAQMSSMSIFPNPTSEDLHIKVSDAKALEGYRYRILDALGKEVYNELVKMEITKIPLKNLGAAGIYHFEVIDQKNTSIQSNKIVFQ